MTNIDDLTNLFIDFGIAYAFEKDSEDEMWHQCHDAIIAYADEIRRECAEKAGKWWLDPNSENNASAMIAAIMGRSEG